MGKVGFRVFATVLLSVSSFLFFLLLYITYTENNWKIFLAGFAVSAPLGIYLASEGLKFLASRIADRVVYLRDSRERWALLIIILSVLFISDVVDYLARTSIFRGDESQSAALSLGVMVGVFFTYFLIQYFWVRKWEEENNSTLFISR